MVKRIITAGIIVCFASACDKAAESTAAGTAPKEQATVASSTTTDEPTTTGKKKDSSHPNAAGSLAINESVANDLGTTNANLLVVQENMAPPTVGALAIGSQGGSAAMQLLSTQTKAAEVQTRIKGTIEGTMRAIDWVRGTINMVEPQLLKEQNKSEGTIDLGYSTIQYKFESEHKYKLFILGGEGGDFHISIEDNHYLLKRRPSKTETIHPGVNFVDITYVDENNWTVKDDNTSDNCLNRPKVLTSYVERKNGIWAGKLMYWGGNLGGVCADAPAESAIDFSYFEFIGNTTVTTAAGYEYVPVSLADFSNIGQYGFIDETLVSVNPVCIGAQDLITPQTACASDNIDISTPTYGIADQLVLPADMVKIWNVFPEIL